MTPKTNNQKRARGDPTNSELGRQTYGVEIELRNGRELELTFNSISDQLPTTRSFHIPSKAVGDLAYVQQDQLIGALIDVTVDGETYEGYVDAIEWHGDNEKSLLLRIKSL